MSIHYSVYTSDQPMPRRRRKRIWWFLGLAFIAVIGWFVAGPILALRNIQDAQDGGQSFLGFIGNIVSGAQLKGEADGRINVLLLGVGGKNHPGGTLADTIQVVSINTKDKQVAVLSIPRDLRVTIPGAGTNKINYAHAYGELNPKTGGGPAVIRQVVSQVTGLPIHYYVRMDFEGFAKLVDALGGVDITVEKAINDPFYPAADMIRYDPFSIAAGQHHMKGETALKYVRSRETTSDFDRSKRQQQMLEALKDRALTLNILTNPRKVNEIASILGQHVRTDLTTWEITRVVELAAREVKSYSLITRVLSSGPGEPLVGVNEGGYYLVPRTGNFKEIQDIAKNIFTEFAIEQENAAIEIVNASGKSATLNLVTTNLKNQGYKVVKTRTAETALAASALVDFTNGAKPNTLKLLAQRFKIKASVQTKPAGSTIDITIVVGQDYEPSSQ